MGSKFWKLFIKTHSWNKSWIFFSLGIICQIEETFILCGQSFTWLCMQMFLCNRSHPNHKIKFHEKILEFGILLEF